MKLRLISCLMIITILLGGFNTISLANTDNEDGKHLEPTIPAPNLVIGRNYRMPVLKAGEEARLAIPIENTSRGEAKDVFVMPVIENSEDFPFEINTMVTKKKISSISGRNTETVAFYLNVKKTAKAKTYPININMEYSSEDGGSYSTRETIYIKIENEYNIPDLKLINTEITGKKLISGETKTVGFTIQNKGDLIAKDIEIQLSGFVNNQLLLDSPIDTIKLPSLEAGEAKSVFFNILADEELESGNYSLDVNIKYKDEYGEEYRTETKAYLLVEAKGTQKTNFIFRNLKYPETEIGTYTDFDISFDLKNNGETDVNNIKVSIDGGEEILPKSMSIKNIPKLEAGKEKNIQFTLFAKDNIESKNYPIKITVQYETGTGSRKEIETVEQYIGVLINSDDKEIGEPKIIIENYNYGSEFIEAGSEFPLEMSFYNTNNKEVRNIRVSISSDGDVFSPIGSSNSFYIPNIPGKARNLQKIYLKPKIDAEYKTYNIFADIEYEDTKGKTYSTKELISVPVIQKSKLVMGDVEFSSENFVGTPIALSVEFYNAGRGLMRNMIISIEGDFETNEGSLYIGNLESGKNNYYDATIIPLSAGTLEGKITFNYDDEIDQNYIIEKEFSIEIMEQMEEIMPDDFMVDMEEYTEDNNKKYIIIGSSALLIVIISYIFYKRRKKKLEEVDIYE